MIRTKNALSQYAVEQMQLKMKAFLGKIGHPDMEVLILGHDVEMDVVRPEEVGEVANA